MQSQLSALTQQLGALPSLSSLTSQVSALLGQIGGLLDPVLDIVDGLLDRLGTAPLVVIEDIAAGVTTLASSSLDGSSAVADGSIGAVRVGNLTLPGVDGLGAVEQLNALTGQLTSALGEVLSVIDPVLAGLVDVDLLQRTTDVRGEGGRNIAEAAISALSLDITPPDLCALLGRLGATPVLDTLGGLLASVGQALPATPLPIADVLGDLGSQITCGATAGAQEARRSSAAWRRRSPHR